MQGVLIIQVVLEKHNKCPLKMATKTKTGLCAIITTLVAFLFVIISFSTPCWLETDGEIKDPKFIRIGLWEVCFQGLCHFKHNFETNFTGCWWVFEEEYYIISDFLFPPFFIATQFFFTLCLTLVLVAMFLTWMYCFCSRHHDKYFLLLLTTGTDLLLAGMFGLIAVLIFGVNGDRRDWMPHWEHNDLSWSFAFGVLGSLLLLPAGTLFLVEARRMKYRRLREAQPPQSHYSMETRKPSHTDI